MLNCPKCNRKNLLGYTRVLGNNTEVLDGMGRVIGRADSVNGFFDRDNLTNSDGTPLYLSWNYHGEKASLLCGNCTLEWEKEECIVEHNKDWYAGGVAQIFYNNNAGKTRTLYVCGSDNIHSIKKQIEVKEGIPIRVQRLRKDGKLLEDDRTLFDYHIKSHCNLHLDLIRILG